MSLILDDYAVSALVDAYEKTPAGKWEPFHADSDTPRLLEKALATPHEEWDRLRSADTKRNSFIDALSNNRIPVRRHEMEILSRQADLVCADLAARGMASSRYAKGASRLVKTGRALLRQNVRPSDAGCGLWDIGLLNPDGSVRYWRAMCLPYQAVASQAEALSREPSWEQD